MPSVVSRPAAPLALTPLLPDEQRSPCVILRGAVCPALPDLDVAGFEFGVPYGHMLGHRGLSHSVVFALLLSACVVWLLPVVMQSPPSEGVEDIFPSLSLGQSIRVCSARQPGLHSSRHDHCLFHWGSRH